MIRRLRARHRRVFTALAVLLPLGLILAFTSRNDVPPTESAPRAGSLVELPGMPAARDEIARAGTLALRVRVWPSSAAATGVVELAPERDPELPDVLVYWSASHDDGELPAQCLLLGSLAGAQVRRFVLPVEARGGSLYFYSLAHAELVLRVELER